MLDEELLTFAGNARREMEGNTRVTGKEQYYTPKKVAEAIFERIISKNPDLSKSVFLEPAGGTGVFIEVAKSYGFDSVVSMDIEPKHPEVALGDFLKSDLEIENAICITNPPFGRNNALSVPFFNKAAEYSDLIAFIVPKSWHKWSVLNRLDLNFHMVDSWDLHIDYQDDRGFESHGVGNLKTCVQVWRRQEIPRTKVSVPDYGIIQKTTHEEADVSLTIFGYGCGTVRTDFPRRKNTTQMFLKLEHPMALEALQSVDFSRFYNNTAYTEALSIKEINYLLNEYLGLSN